MQVMIVVVLAFLSLPVASATYQDHSDIQYMKEVTGDYGPRRKFTLSLLKGMIAHQSILKICGTEIIG